MSWHTRAACRTADPRLFDDTTDPAPALAYCAVCPVVAECLAWVRADNHGKVRSARYSGVAGGRVVFEGAVQPPINPARSWGDEHVRECHLAYQHYGNHSAEAYAGEREYNRRAKARREARKAAA